MRMTVTTPVEFSSRFLKEYNFLKRKNKRLQQCEKHPKISLQDSARRAAQGIGGGAGGMHQILGWREKCGLCDLGNDKAKIFLITAFNISCKIHHHSDLLERD
jgi:hypothetical protein